MEWVIVLPFASPSQNQYQRWHWAQKRRVRDQAALIIRCQARGMGIERAAGRRRIDILRTGKKLLDYGNLVGGMKPIVDALVNEGLLLDDGPKAVEDHYAQQVLNGTLGFTRILIMDC